MEYKYPYKSRNRKYLKTLRLGQDYTIWRKKGLDLRAEVLEFSKKPVIEIGGPTRDGYYFLDDIEFGSKPVITNYPENSWAFSFLSKTDKKRLASLIDETIDGRKMPYQDASAGIFLMAAMSRTSDWYLELSEEEQNKQKDKIENEFEVAQLEEQQVAIGVLPPEKVQFAQRIQIYLEIQRALCPGGLFFSDGAVDEIFNLQRLGFELVAYVQEHVWEDMGWAGISYEFLMRKLPV